MWGVDFDETIMCHIPIENGINGGLRVANLGQIESLVKIEARC